MSDLISRQTAIDAIGNLSDEIYGNIEKGATFPPKAWFDGMAQAEHIVRNLPPAQPEILACGEGELNVPDTNVGDMISRQAAIDALDEQIEQCNKALGSFDISSKDEYAIKVERASLKAYKEQLENMPSAQPEQVCVANVTLTDEQVKEVVEKAKNAVISVIELEPHWIPCSERLPDDLAEVNVTWVNHEPEPYYESIKSKPFTASAVYYEGNWYWYSSVCADVLAEYGRNDVDKVDDTIEITAWKPLPEPYQGGETE